MFDWFWFTRRCEAVLIRGRSEGRIISAPSCGWKTVITSVVVAFGLGWGPVFLRKKAGDMLRFGAAFGDELRSHGTVLVLIFPHSIGLPHAQGRFPARGCCQTEYSRRATCADGFREYFWRNVGDVLRFGAAFAPSAAQCSSRWWSQWFSSATPRVLGRCAVNRAFRGGVGG